MTATDGDDRMHDPHDRPDPQTLPEMEARRDEVENALAALRGKLDNVRARRHVTGEYADPDWYRRAVTRLRFTGVEHQRLTRRIADMKRQQRQEARSNIDRAFVSIARDRLGAVEFDTIMAKARAATE